MHDQMEPPPQCEASDDQTEKKLRRVPSSSTSSTSPPVHSLYRGVVLAPMVRCGSLPLRVLALRYGADAVWGEEIIAQKLAGCTRVLNPVLGTVDFVTPPGGGSGTGTGTVVLRTCPALERGRFVCQLGAADPTTALAAARVVQHDVAGIDLNMGCPIKFSVQGGMGAALLKKPDTAEAIVRVLAQALEVPVSVKMRLLETPCATAAFARRMASAGAACVTVHLRGAGERDRVPAHWDQLAAVVDAIKRLETEEGRRGGEAAAEAAAAKARATAAEEPPATAAAAGPGGPRGSSSTNGTFTNSSVSCAVMANGDLYRWEDAQALVASSGCAGVMLARPALLNASVFLDFARRRRRGGGGGVPALGDAPVLERPPLNREGCPSNVDAPVEASADAGAAAAAASLLVPIDQVIRSYLEECVRWDLVYQNAKYTVLEMLNNRRHQKRFCPCKLDLGPGRTMPDVGRAKSVRELAALFGLDESACTAIEAKRATETPEAWFARPVAEPAGLPVGLPAGLPLPSTGPAAQQEEEKGEEQPPPASKRAPSENTRPAATLESETAMEPEDDGEVFKRRKLYEGALGVRKARP